MLYPLVFYHVERVDLTAPPLVAGNKQCGGGGGEDYSRNKRQ